MVVVAVWRVLSRLATVVAVLAVRTMIGLPELAAANDRGSPSGARAQQPLAVLAQTGSDAAGLGPAGEPNTEAPGPLPLDPVRYARAKEQANSRVGIGAFSSAPAPEPSGPVTTARRVRRRRLRA